MTVNELETPTIIQQIRTLIAPAYSYGPTALGAPVAINSGFATLTTTQLSNGPNSITAAYSGDSNFNASTSVAASVIVGNPDFQIAVNPGNVTVSSATPGTATILISPGPGLGLAGKVSFTCSGQPSGTSCTFQPATLSLDGFTPQTTMLTISRTASANLIRSSGGGYLVVRQEALALHAAFSSFGLDGGGRDSGMYWFR